MNFNQKVYAFLKQVPKGKVVTYGQVAVAVGSPYASRAVGYALHHNPDPVTIPCHRVVFKDGRLTSSFAFGGIEKQAELLKKEGVTISSDFKADMKKHHWRPMKTQFLLVRHGETDWNKEKRCQGWTDIPLNETGMAQAEKISKQIKKGDYTALYTSDLKRAFQTADILNETLSLPINVAKELRELNHGEAEGKTDIRQIYGDILKIMYDNTHPNCFEVRIPLGENRREVLDRLLPFLKKLAHTHKGENILLVSHGNLIVSLYLAFHKNDFMFKNGDALKFSYDIETDVFCDFKAFSFEKE